MSPQKRKADRFVEHLEPLQKALEVYCRRCLSDANAVEDVLQSAIGNAFRDFDLFAEGTNFRAWIFRYVNLEIKATNRTFWAKSHASLIEEPEADDDWRLNFDEAHFDALLDSPDAVLQHCDEALAGAISLLNPLERSVLLLKAIGGFKYREIADIAGVPMGTVMSSLARARERLRHQLVEYGREHGLLSRPQTGKAAPHENETNDVENGEA
ncbi:MAG: sigma-70 family RNA polymerase sigma factor [Planctomycetota bacterium]|nr:sigma-70 family RNA polymerase sigma factor [Planctomycetota bacterium]